MIFVSGCSQNLAEEVMVDIIRHVDVTTGYGGIGTFSELEKALA